MSSRIVGDAELAGAEPLQWRSIGAVEPAVAFNNSGKTASESSGPTWEGYRALEAQLRELQAQILAREQQARALGLREGEAAAIAKWEAALERLARAIHELAALRPRLRKDAEQDVLKLSLAVAKRVLRRELSIDPEAVLSLVRSAVERLDLREAHRVRVRPDDVASVRKYLDKIGGPSAIEVLGDPTLERGAVLFETTRGAVDASLETQLEEIERGFTDILERKQT